MEMLQIIVSYRDNSNRIRQWESCDIYICLLGKTQTDFHFATLRKHSETINRAREH